MKLVFLRAADSARPLLDHPQLGVRWHGPSPLARMTMGDLTGHLARAVMVVPGYLDTVGDGPTVDAAGYFLALEGLRRPDLDGDLATGVRARATEAAAGGLGAVRSAWDEARAELGVRFSREDGDRTIAVRGSSMHLDDYLATRLVELVVHADDMAAGLDADLPEFDDEVTGTVVAVLWEMARRTSRPLEIIRAMTRTERDTGALQVM